jgi:IclR family acetate operon transcriptional repressor
LIKRSRSGSRILAVLETIARHQPVGVSELARVLAQDKSAVQRAIMTLADEGWVQASPGKPTRWELSGHIYAVANMGYGNNDLRRRARRALEQLRDDCGETVLLNVPDVRRFVVVDVVESRQNVRAAPQIGTLVPVRGSATARAMLPVHEPRATGPAAW